MDKLTNDKFKKDMNYLQTELHDALEDNEVLKELIADKYAEISKLTQEKDQHSESLKVMAKLRNIVLSKSAEIARLRNAEKELNKIILDKNADISRMTNDNEILSKQLKNSETFCFHNLNLIAILNNVNADLQKTVKDLQESNSQLVARLNEKDFAMLMIKPEPVDIKTEPQETWQHWNKYFVLLATFFGSYCEENWPARANNWANDIKNSWNCRAQLLQSG